VDLVFEKIKSTLEGGEAVKLSGFGNFIVHDKRARRGRNPQTGESITISSRKVLSFRPSQLLKAKVNR
jgi:integration host factor subunit alpha